MSHSILPGSDGDKIAGSTVITSTGPVHFNINNTQDTRPGSGFDRLERASLQEALRNSSTQGIAHSFEGTRTEHRQSITNWGKGEWKSQNARVMWMDGPAGVGKSPLAQAWMEDLGDKFAAAFFFSRDNGWNQPIRLIPTISYQLATKYDSYRVAVDAAIIQNPLLLQQSIDVQFQGLLVKPLRELSHDDRKAADNAIIIIDGLDECSGFNTMIDSSHAQVTIINTIISSAATRTSPFLWGVLSRPESHILHAFSSKQAVEITWHLTLPLQAPDADKDMEAYLLDAFGTIRRRYPSIQSSWPPEDSLKQLVRQSDGLFAYGTSAIRYVERDVGEVPNSRLGPEERLRLVLEQGQGSQAKLSKLDQLYLLVMDQIPKNILPDTLLILYANHYYTNVRRNRFWRAVPILSSLLGFSQSAFYDAVAPLHSVLRVATTGGMSHPSLTIYHASFTDFITAPKRSTAKYCIMSSQICSRFYSTSVDVLHRPLAPSSLSKRYEDYVDDFNNDEEREIIIRQAAMDVLIKLPSTIHYFKIREHPDILERLAQINWSTEAEAYHFRAAGRQIAGFAKQIPKGWRLRIIQPKNMVCKAVWLMSGLPSGWTYILGSGGKSALFTHTRKGGLFYLVP